MSRKTAIGNFWQHPSASSALSPCIISGAKRKVRHIGSIISALPTTAAWTDMFASGIDSKEKPAESFGGFPIIWL